MRAVKYGVTRNYVLALDLYKIDGTKVHLGASTYKFSAGLNLQQLIVGSEGTLGVITKIVLKLLPMPEYTLNTVIAFDSLKTGIKNVNVIFKAHLDPNNHVLVKCSAVGNTASGFDRNNQNGVVTMKYCVASKNGKYNYNWPATGKPSALGYTVKFGTAQIIGCSSSNGKNNISGARLSGNCKGF